MHKVLIFSNGEYQLTLSVNSREDARQVVEAFRGMCTDKWQYQTFTIFDKDKP